VGSSNCDTCAYNIYNEEDEGYYCEANMDEDDIIWVKEGGIDFDREVLEAVTLELPVYHLCCDDCPGLCDTWRQRSPT